MKAIYTCKTQCGETVSVHGTTEMAVEEIIQKAYDKSRLPIDDVVHELRLGEEREDEADGEPVKVLEALPAISAIHAPEPLQKPAEPEIQPVAKPETEVEEPAHQRVKAPTLVRIPKPVQPGRSAKDVTDPDEVQRIKAAYKGNGGFLSFNQIEREFGLRPTNGMTAYRIINRMSTVCEQQDVGAHVQAS